MEIFRLVDLSIYIRLGLITICLNVAYSPYLVVSGSLLYLALDPLRLNHLIAFSWHIAILLITYKAIYSLIQLLVLPL